MLLEWLFIVVAGILIGWYAFVLMQGRRVEGARAALVGIPLAMLMIAWLYAKWFLDYLRKHPWAIVEMFVTIALCILAVYGTALVLHYAWQGGVAW